MDQGYSHGFIVFGLFVYLLVGRLRVINYLEIKPFYYVLPVLLVLSLINILSLYANIQLIQWLTLPILFFCFFVLVYGIRQSRKLLFPFVLLLFAIPVWDYLVIPLQNITVFINTELLKFFQITAFIDGYFVAIPSGTFEIAGGCSGLRYLIVILALSSLHGYLNYSLWRTWMALIFIACIFGLVTNWLRVFFIILIGYETEMQSSLIKEHEFFGWILFAIILVPLFYIAHKLPNYFYDEAPEEVKLSKRSPSSINLSVYVVAFVGTLSLPIIIQPSVSSIINQPLPEPPGAIVQQPLLVKPIYHGADHSFDHVLYLNNRNMQVSFRAYDVQRQGKELIAYNNVNYSKNWKLLNSYKREGFVFNVIQHRYQDYNVLLASRYNISGISTSNVTIAKLLELFKPLMTNSRSSAFILASMCNESCNSTEKQMLQFISGNAIYIEGLHGGREQ